MTRSRFAVRLVALAVLAGAAIGGFAPSSTASGRPLKPGVGKDLFGTMPDGTKVWRYTLTNGSMRVRVITYGGIIQTIETPDRHGRLANVTLGFPTLSDYLTKNSTYFGALIGRYGNRIAKGRFALDGHEYQLTTNNNGNTLHGGTTGFDQRVWSATPITGGGGVALRLSHTSPDGDQGFPGTLKTDVTISVTRHNAIRFDYGATTDKPTVVNLTNHSYFNLSGEGSGTVYDHRLQINGSRYTPVGSSELIPTGRIAPVRGTPLDFTRPAAIGARIRTGFDQLLYGQGYDHNFALDGSGWKVAARVHDPASGRTLAISTDQPGLQFYSGNFLDGTLVGTGGRVYRQGDGFALETQHFPDSPNHADFPSTELDPGRTYHSTTVYQFGA
ncbi:aldose 1-epimerase [Actinomadura coerulea]|uniref:Aldose 1-epimerase n=1 Tax=Actinomadura coerulea TaxID=46159 RepID=A0A7X0FVR1_9ACTN|nr:aldose epimerase family protein [Actinomadura coerulea]MBB6394610.1 aldose 1-epimerase [Actinomadura coerulea]GGQ29913.1 aldose 1-epimerase [Actinomadura coerulea]